MLYTLINIDQMGKMFSKIAPNDITVSMIRKVTQDACWFRTK